jgi:RNA polymerase sigma-70 factor (ECF subfamily)
LVHRLRNFWRKQKYEQRGRGTSSLLEQLRSLEDDNSDVTRTWTAEHDQYVISQLLQAVRPRFQAKTWDAFHRQMFDGERPDVVAAALGMSLSSVYVARNRVLSALRREAEGLVDSL